MDTFFFNDFHDFFSGHRSLLLHVKLNFEAILKGIKKLYCLTTPLLRPYTNTLFQLGYKDLTITNFIQFIRLNYGGNHLHLISPS